MNNRQIIEKVLRDHQTEFAGAIVKILEAHDIFLTNDAVNEKRRELGLQRIDAKTMRVREYMNANPDASQRKIAKDCGVSITFAYQMKPVEYHDERGHPKGYKPEHKIRSTDRFHVYQKQEGIRCYVFGR